MAIHLFKNSKLERVLTLLETKTYLAQATTPEDIVRIITPAGPSNGSGWRPDPKPLLYLCNLPVFEPSQATRHSKKPRTAEAAQSSSPPVDLVMGNDPLDDSKYEPPQGTARATDPGGLLFFFLERLLLLGR